MAYSFGVGTTDKVEINSGLSVSSRDRTMYARVKLNSVNTSQREIAAAYNSSTGATYAFFFDTFSGVVNNNIRFGFSTGGGVSFPVLNWTSGFSAGSEHILIATYDGAQLALYADADATAKATTAETGTPDVPTSLQMRIGNALSPNTASWDGIIYEVAYWDGTALDSSDRAVLQGGGTPLETAVVPTHFWSFDVDASDDVGAADGTVTGATFVSEGGGGTTTETLAPDAVLASSNLTGATLANIDEDPASNDGSWATATSNNITTTLRVSFPTPSAALSGDQTFRALVRKTGTSGTGTPTATLSLYENGSLISADTAENVTSTTGQVVSYTWSSTGRTASQIECLITGTLSGGGPSVRAAVDIGAVAWDATIVSSAAALSASGAGSATATATALHLTATLSASGAGGATATATALHLPHGLSASGAGTATATATALMTMAVLSASGAGIATGTATALNQTQPLAASGAGVAAGTATALNLPRSLAANGAGVATTSATTLVVAAELSASGAGVATASATTLLDLEHDMSAAGSGSSIATATGLNLTAALSASGSGVATGTADLSQAGAGANLSATGAGSATTAATVLQLPHALSASGAGSAAGTATTLALPHALVASGSGSATGTADLSIGGAGAVLTASGAGVANGSADLTIEPAGAVLTASGAGSSTASATTIQLSHPLTAFGAGAATVAATTLIFLAGAALTASGAGSATGSANLTLPQTVYLSVVVGGDQPAVTVRGGDGRGGLVGAGSSQALRLTGGDSRP